MGQNGSGKTTLLKCLMKNENKISGFNGDVRPNLKYFYFDQTQQLLNPDLRDALKKAGLLTRDSRVVERKKAGLKKARKGQVYQRR